MLKKIPNFRALAEEEDKPADFYRLTPEMQETWIRNVVKIKRDDYSCKTSNLALNLCIGIITFLFLTMGGQVFSILNTIVKGKLGLP